MYSEASVKLPAIGEAAGAAYSAKAMAGTDRAPMTAEAIRVLRI